MSKLVKLYPVEGVSVNPYPPEVIELPEEEAEFVLGHTPPPFTRTPPKKAAQQPEAAPEGAVSDSPEA